MPEPRSPAKLLELATGYQRSKVLFTLIELEVPSFLADGARTLEEIAARIRADPLATECLLNACVALDLLIRDGDRFRNAADAQRFLVRGAPGYLGDVFRRHDSASYPAWARLAERLRAWRPGAAKCWAPLPGDCGVDSIRSQHGLSLLLGGAVGEALDLSSRRRLLDLGGGTGAMSIALCRR